MRGAGKAGGAVLLDNSCARRHDPPVSSGQALGKGGTMAIVEHRIEDAVGTIVLNHGEKRNALSEVLIDGIIQALEAFRRDKLRAVVMRAPSGTRVWSAGHDIVELPNAGRDPLGWSDPLRILIRAIEEFPAPVVALIEGGVWGGACEVVLACDVVVATPSATFAITPAKLGVPYNITGLLTFLNAAPLPVVKEMLFTAAPITAERAERLGFVNHICEPDEIDAFVDRMTRTIAGNAPLSIAVMKEELRLLASAHSITPRMFERLQGLRRVVYDSSDYEEGKRAFLEKRRPQFRGE
jgi:methylmalonyl-CoA decarboxylase